MNATVKTSYKATYNDIGGPNGLLATKDAFVGNSMSARWEYIGGDFIYQVFSYLTLIAAYYPPRKVGEDEMRWHTDDRYSVTTSRHQNLCKAWL